MLTVENARQLAQGNSIPEPNTGCRLWLGAVAQTKGGDYATVRVDGRRVLLARAMLGLTDRRIFACHHCDTPACVNEDHLFRGRQRENMADMARKGRAWNPTADRLRARTHCKNGHRYTPENTGRNDCGRVCRTCVRERLRRRRADRGVVPGNHNALKTHCANGHLFTPENTRWYDRGTYKQRCCRACETENNRRRRAH